MVKVEVVDIQFGDKVYKNVAVERLNLLTDEGRRLTQSSKRKKKMSKNEAIDLIRGNLCIECGYPVNEDLRNWFKQKWVNIGKDKSGKHPNVEQVVRREGKQVCTIKKSPMSKKEKKKVQLVEKEQHKTKQVEVGKILKVKVENL